MKAIPATQQVSRTVGAQTSMCELELAVKLHHEKGNIVLFGRRNMKGTVQGNGNCKTFGIQLKNTSADFL
jgi:hypothetical protein